jgi:hypothetical protein
LLWICGTKTVSFRDAAMKNSLWLVGVVGALGLVSACGDDEKPGFLPEGGTRNGGTGGKTQAGSQSTDAGDGGIAGDAPNGGRGGTAPNAGRGGTNVVGQGGAGGDQGGSGSGGEGGVPLPDNGITVTMTAPEPAINPNTDVVLVGDEVTVKCVVRADDPNAPVSPSTVRIRAFDADGAVVLGLDEQPMNVPGAPTGQAEEYEATFPLATVATGAVSFGCSARGVDPSVSGSAAVSALVDHGPSITAKLPEANSAHALTGIMAVEFTVLPRLVAPQDTEAGVADVVLHVAGVEIDAIEDAQNKGTYRASVNFLDKQLFEEVPPEHSFISIDASNARTPAPGSNGLSYAFVVDGAGPLIAFTKPKANSTANGPTTVGFTARDTGAGLDVDTVKVTITGLGEVSYEADDTSWTRTGDLFTYTFDTGVLENVESQIVVSVQASDAAGNPTDSSDLQLYLDDLPPTIDLDAGNARAKSSDDKCSASFDPLGDALNDLSVTTVRNNRFRAIVYDQTNFGSGQDFAYMSGTNPASVRLYVQPNPSQSFLVDRSGDGVCDDLANENFEYRSLTAVPKGGVMVFAQDSAVAPAVGGSCTLQPPAATPPDTMCGDNSDMTTVVQHQISTNGNEPVVYALGSLANPECTGSKWDLGTVAGIATNPTGWICLAVRASDNLKNQSVSRPLRVCFDDPGVAGQPACATGAPPPTCTTSCTAPPAYPAHIYRF